MTFDCSTPLHSFHQCAFVLGDNVRLKLPPSLSGPPSAPRNAISNVNETSVFLEWSVPMETGGRKDVRYNILCRRVLPDGRGLEECGPNVRFLPRRVGLTNTSVMVADLQSHTNYSFLLEAVNGVSELAKDHAKQYVSLNVTTNQAGMLRQICHKYQVFSQPPPDFYNQCHSWPVFSSPVFKIPSKRSHHHFVMILYFPPLLGLPQSNLCVRFLA